MTIEEENVATLRALYDAWNDTRGGSIDLMLAAVDDCVSWKSLAAGADGMPFTHECRSRDDVHRYFRGMAEDWEILEYRVVEYIAQGERVVALSETSYRHRRTGKQVKTPKADVVRVRDGKVVEFFEFYDTARAEAAALP